MDTSVKRGDIYYADLSPVVGSEQGGVRPVLIIQNDTGNRYSPTVIAAAITSQTGKAKLPTHIDLPVDHSCGLSRDSVVLLEQVRTLDKKRLREKMGHVEENVIGYIPVVLLIRAFDNESYLSHLGSGADRLELRTESICRLRANIRMLVENRMVLRERVKLFLSDAVFPMVPTKEEMETENTDQIFMDKVNKILEKNLSTDKYTIDKLSIDIGMSRTAFYSRIREITGNPPENYIYSFKMDRALKLLASQQYTVSEIAGMLGYCDAKYFGKKFKDFYHVCPTDYIKSIIG